MTKINTYQNKLEILKKECISNTARYYKWFTRDIVSNALVNNTAYTNHVCAKDDEKILDFGLVNQKFREITYLSYMFQLIKHMQDKDGNIFFKFSYIKNDETIKIEVKLSISEARDKGFGSLVSITSKDNETFHNFEDMTLNEIEKDRKYKAAMDIDFETPKLAPSRYL